MLSLEIEYVLYYKISHHSYETAHFYSKNGYNI